MSKGETVSYFKNNFSSDLNKGYYHIKICPFSRKLCTIVLPWDKYKYQKLPMGLCNSPDIFQETINTLFNGLDYDFLHKVRSKLKSSGFKINVEKSLENN